MNRGPNSFLLILAPAAAIVVALLGLETLQSVTLGWLLLLLGVLCAGGVVIVYWIRHERLETSAMADASTREGARSLWLLVPGLLAAFLVPPLEYVYVDPILPRTTVAQYIGVPVALFGLTLLIWSGYISRAFAISPVSVRTGRSWFGHGPYRVIRHPDEAGVLLLALGIGAGYSSIFGMLAIAVLLLPGLMYRMHVEDRFLAQQLGDLFKQYSRATARLIPGVW